jgi:hypothetical protein
VSARLLIAAALACAAPAAAAAADPAQLDCPVAALSGAERRGLAENVAALGPREDPNFQRFQDAVARCAERYGWSDEQQRLARVHNVSAVGQAELRRRLTGLGVALAEIERAALADAEFAAAARAGQMGPDVIGAFTGRHRVLIERVLAGRSHDRDRGELLGRFILFRVMTDISRDQFRAS